MRRQQFGQRAIARSDVEHVAAIEQAGQRARQRFPGAAGRVVAFHVAGDGVGPAFGVRAFGEDGRQAAQVVGDQRIVDVGAQRASSAPVLSSRSLLLR